MMSTHESPAAIPSGFWGQIDHQLARITAERADTFAAVASILNDPAYDAVRAYAAENPAPAFFAGSGGDATLAGALRAAGWSVTTYEAHYHYAMRHPDTGAALTYVEGDIYDGDDLTPAAERAEDIADHESESGFWDGETGEPLTDADIEERYADMLEDVYGEPMGHSAARILREVDPIAYRCGMSDYTAAECEAGALTDNAEHAADLRAEVAR